MKYVELEKLVKIVNALPVCIFLLSFVFIYMSGCCDILVSYAHAVALYLNHNYLFTRQLVVL